MSVPLRSVIAGPVGRQPCPLQPSCVVRSFVPARSRRPWPHSSDSTSAPSRHDVRPRRVVASVCWVEAELAELRAEVWRLRAENERLSAVLRLSPSEAGPPGPTQIGGLGSVAGPLSLSSTPAAKVGFFADLFSARRDVYAVRWESARTAKSGWMPAVAGGWRRGMDPRSTTYLPLTTEVVTAHLAGEIDLGLYPLLGDDTCHWLAADFDGASSMLDALAFLKAARAHRVPAALEVSRSGIGAHVWTFFTAPVQASVARQLGIG